MNEELNKHKRKQDEKIKKFHEALSKDKLKIKFRLVLNNNIVGYETHVIDSRIGHIGIYHKRPDETGLKYGYPVTMGDRYYIFHDKKEQFTGLYDKNNVEIYVGDIVSYPEYPNHISITGSHLLPAVVIFKNGKFISKSNYVSKSKLWDSEKDLLEWLPSKTYLKNYKGEDVSVIGDIHNNPELLEV